MRTISFTVRRHARPIPEGYRHGRTNAVAEDNNNAIKVLKRKSYGFGNFKRRRGPLIALGSYRPQRDHVTLREARRTG